MRANVLRRHFATKADAQAWVNRQVIRRVLETSYLVSVHDAARPDRIEVLDTAASEFEPRPGDEPLKRHAMIRRRDGRYQVGLPADEQGRILA